ncbi:hypothetical protein D3C80_1425810 [compost metagenome]
MVIFDGDILNIGVGLSGFFAVVGIYGQRFLSAADANTIIVDVPHFSSNAHIGFDTHADGKVSIMAVNAHIPNFHVFNRAVGFTAD